MQIETKLEPKELVDYDFTLEGAVGLPFTLDTTLGDTIKFGDPDIIVTLAPRPHLSDPTKLSPGREVTIKTSKVLAYVKTTRQVIPLPDEQARWKALTSSSTKS